jgi:EAL domain-containing protein (putative c-di-GMP-specific phosphodiesterase class I)
LPGQTDGVHLLQSLHARIRMAEGHHLLRLSYGVAAYGPRSSMADLLTACDQSLGPLTNEGVTVRQADTLVSTRANREWNRILDAAFQNHEFELAFFPVQGTGNAYLYAEGLARIRSSVAGERLVAGAFLPWARRRGQAGLVDLEILSLALVAVKEQGHDICINLGFESVCDERQVGHILERLNQNLEQAGHLYLDIPEEIAFDRPLEFARFCERVIPMGYRIGVEHLDRHVGHLGSLHSLGLRYVKVSRALIAGVAQDVPVQAMLRSLCTISHTMGLQVVAEGVSQKVDVSLLFEIGFDGVTGHAVA